MLAKQTLSLPWRVTVTVYSLPTGFKVQVQKCRTQWLQNYSLGNGNAVPKSLTHFWIRTRWKLPARNVAGKSDWDSSVLLAGQETLANFVLQLFLYFRLDNGIALMFSLKQPLSLGNLPGGPVVRTLHSHCRGHGSIPGFELRSHRPCATAQKI